MTTSGTITFDLTALEVVTQAYRNIGIYGARESLNSEDYAIGQQKLNLMFKSWQMLGVQMHNRAEQTVSLVDGTQVYTLSTRPARVENVRFAVDGVERYPMTEWAREDWDRLPAKTSEGTPVVYVIDRLIASTTLTVWKVPDVPSGETWTLKVSYERVPEDVTAASQTLDIPQEWLEGVIDNLSIRIAPGHYVEPAIYAEVKERAFIWLNQMIGNDRQGYVRFEVGA